MLINFIEKSRILQIL